MNQNEENRQSGSSHRKLSNSRLQPEPLVSVRTPKIKPNLQTKAGGM